MELLNVAVARTIWLFETRDLNPSGRYMPELISWIQQFCKFAEAPDLYRKDSDEKLNSSGLVFKQGRYKKTEDYSVAVESLTIYTDGIVIDMASSTEDGENLAAEIMAAAVRDFGLAYNENTVRHRLYLSQLIVRSAIDLQNLLSPKATTIPFHIANAVGRKPFIVGGITFLTEALGGDKVLGVRFERQVGKDFSENRYFSEAPIHTEAHLALLRQIENDMA